MKPVSFVLCFALLTPIFTRAADTTTPLRPNVLLDGGQMLLPNGWKITPAGKATELPGDMPERVLFTPGGKQLLVNTGGYNEHGISVIDPATGKLTQHVKVPRTFVGMCIDAKGEHVYLSGGETWDKNNDVTYPPLRQFKLDNGILDPGTPINIEGLQVKKAFITGVAAAPDGSIFVANINQDCVYHVQPENGKVIAMAKVGYRPCVIALSPDDKTLAVANWGGASVSFVDPDSMKERSRIDVGSHPADLLWKEDGRVFVACAGTNTVQVIDTKLEKPRVIEVIRTSLDPKAPIGSTPISLASAGDKLYVANADNNDVAVVDIENRSESEILGFIPTGWYPSAIGVSNDGKKLYVGTAHGLRFGPNNNPKRYIGTMIKGHVSIVDAPDEKALHDYTAQVIHNTPVGRDPKDLGPDEKRVLSEVFPKIKHVLYIIKENRTYDQVFGDIKEGNGDPSLAMFGEHVTPNQHKMAHEWVLLDNLYCNGDVSKDGHLWCDAAYASDFNEKAWKTSYSQRGQPDADDRLNRSPGGYLWDEAIAHGMDFRSYGEREGFISSANTAPQVKDDHMRESWISKPWSAADAVKARDYEKAEIFIKDLHQAEKNGGLPRLMVMSLPENHTHGMSPGAHTPEACVASNDLALGKIVEAVTHSKFWPEIAIFVIEDDAQNGHDHVDAHRTVGLVISPYTRRGAVDSTMYTTVSYVKTMELILGLPSMSQYDAAATPMFNTFTASPDLQPYQSVPVTVNLAAKNPPKGKLAEESAKLDFSDIDLADPDKLNEILWEHYKPGVPMPAPVRSMVMVR